MSTIIKTIGVIVMSAGVFVACYYAVMLGVYVAANLIWDLTQ